MPSWPGTLPDFVLRNGYREGFKKMMQRTQMDSGFAKRRRRFTDAPEQRVWPVEMTSDQLDLFRTFFETDLEGGALSFDRTDPRTGDTKDYAFTKAPDPATPTGYNTYLVVLPLETLP